ncbi:putative Formate dehydrogenase [Rhodotorula taiwanensis]|uniref:Putative Formate dehydrogenase n=1 Tax=Rhodotorula taiwanensis TaxID=741276 RepID=A0A2S5AZD8_9BASI|nr:putative Formate dehydrogenase [Rhodotorula taiwanensis]
MKVLCILYDGGKHAEQEKRLLGTTENALGLPDYCKKNDIELVVTSDKEGPDSEFAKHIVDADVLITTPFHPGYLTREYIEKAKNLKIAITAGVGSDHIDLNAANEKKITVAEVTGSNVVSVAEHIARGEWEVAAIAKGAFDVSRHYDYAPLPENAAKEVGARRVEDLKEFLSQYVLLARANASGRALMMYPASGTRGIMNKVCFKAPYFAGSCDSPLRVDLQETIGYMKKGAWLVNTARGALCDENAVAEAINSGYLSGYGGDVWPKQPAFKEHPWRTMQNPNTLGGNAMVAHYSGTTLDAQIRYANGAIEILDNWRNGKPQTPANLIVENGEYASQAYGQRNKK